MSISDFNAQLEASPRWWKIHQRLEYWAFFLTRLGFVSRTRLARSRTVATLVATFLISEVWRLPIAAALAGASLLLDGLVHSLRPALLARHVTIPGIQPAYADAAVIAVFSALVIVLGLYFAGFTSLAAAAYARVQGDVRELVLKELVSNAFLRLASGTASIALVLLVADVYGRELGYVSLGVLAIATLLTIESFVTVGVSSFRLFDPNFLIPGLQGDISKAIIGATDLGYGYGDRSIQVAYQETAERDLTTYLHMVDMATDLPSTMSALADFGFNLFVFYQSYKHRIPPNSYWYKRKYVHQDWLLADEAQLGTALTASVAIAPRREPDFTWFEKQLSLALTRAMRKIHEQQDPTFIATFDRRLTNAIGLSSNAYAVDEAIYLSNLLLPGFIDFIRAATGNEDDRLSIVSIDVADTIAAMSVHASLGIGNRLDSLERALFQRICEQMRVKGHVPRDEVLPNVALRRLEQLSHSWSFEVHTEGRTVTSAAYAEEMLLRDTLSECWTSIRSLAVHLERDIAGSARSVSSFNPTAGCAIWSRLLESTEKLKLALERFSRAEQRLRPDNLAVEEPWPTFDIVHLSARVAELRQQAVLGMATTVTAVPSVRRSLDLPDVLGQAYHVVCADAFQALLNRDADYFNQLSPHIVSLGRIAIARTVDVLQSGNWQLGCGQIAADMIDLSGYAIVFSELNGCDLWTPLRQEWDGFIGANNDALPQLIRLAHHAQNIPALTNRGVLRVSWEQHFEERLKDERLIQRSHYYPNYLFEPPLKIRRNRTVRALCRRGYLSASAFDVFVARYAIYRDRDLDLSPFRSVRSYIQYLDETEQVPAAREERELKRRRRAERL